MANPPDWSQFYHQNTLFGDTTTVTTTTATSNTIPIGLHSSTTTTTTQLPPEGRVGKPIRRRSRASRRTPTTLLNTDTSNFRAMVQQFTGGPNANAATNFNFNVPPNTTPFQYNIQYGPSSLQGQQNRPYMFQMGGSSVSRDVNYVPSGGGGGSGGGAEGFGGAEGGSSGSRRGNENMSNTFMY